MNLIVDQGNTATKLALFGDENNLILKKVFPKNDLKAIESWILSETSNVNAVLISSVTNDKIEFPQSKKIFLSSKTPLPITIGYDTPDTLGKDRIANAVAVWQKNPNKNSLCIDLGTCIKYDLVTEKGVYLGGNISPGLRMRYQALNAFTDQLPLIEPAEFEYAHGKSTETSIRNGVQQAIFHEINGFIQRYHEQFGQLTIFMTGGDLKYFDKAYKKPIFAVPIIIGTDLTIFGLNEILKYNVEI